MSTGCSIDWSRTARSLENHHLRSRPTQRWNGRALRFRRADERANLRHIYSTMSGPDARSPRYRHHGQSCGSQGRWRAPGNRSGGRVPAISAAVFAGFQSDRTGLQQSEIEAAQGRRAHSQRTLSQNRLDFPLLQNSRMYKFLRACGVWVNVSGICSRPSPWGTFTSYSLPASWRTPFRVKNGPDGPETLLPVYLEQRTSPDRHGWSVQCHSRPSRQLSGRAAGLWSRSITNAPISSLWIYFNYCGLPPILSGLPCASDVM